MTTCTDFESAYREFTAQYPWLAKNEVGRYRRIGSLLDRRVPRGSKVLDIGVWPGVLTSCLQRMGWSMYGVDMDITRSVAWNRADLVTERQGKDPLTLQALCSREGIAVRATDIELEPLPFEDASFRAVCLTEVIEHLWRNPLHALSEVHRVLAEDGILILSTPNLLCLANRFNFALGRIDRVVEHPYTVYLKRERLGHFGHLRLYSAKELVEILSLLGFECEIIFDRMGQFDHAPSSGRTPQEPATGHDGGGEHQDVPRPRKATYGSNGRTLLRFVKSPAGYCRAAVATAVQVTERLIPSWRPQMYIIAKRAQGSQEARRERLARDLVLSNSAN